MAKLGDLCETQGELTIQWQIKDFFSLPDKKNTYYVSHRFYFSGASWEMTMYPNGETENNSEDWIGLYLMRRSIGSPVTLNFSFSLKTINGKKDSVRYYVHSFHRSESGYGCPRLISRSDLSEKKSELTPFNVLTVTCTMKNDETNLIAGSLFNRFQDVSDNLYEIYTKGTSTDVTLKTDEGNIRAHRVILETRSPVFAAMFKHDTKENQTGEIFIKDVDKSTMEAILIYMYSGTFKRLTIQNALPVYSAADKYDVKDAKEMCAKFIADNLSVEWVCEVIKFAELYGEEEIGHYAKEYFKGNAGKILDTVSWKTFAKENHDISVELLALVVKSLLPK